TGSGAQASPTNATRLTVGASTAGGGLSLTTTGAGHDLTVTDNLTHARSITLSSAGNIAQNLGAILTAAGGSFTSTLSGGTITLDQANKLSGTVTLSTTGSGADASLTNAAPLTLGSAGI